MFDMTKALNRQTKTAVSKAWLSVKGALGMGASKDPEKVSNNGVTYMCVWPSNALCSSCTHA